MSRDSTNVPDSPAIAAYEEARISVKGESLFGGKTLDLIAETLIEIRDEMRRSRPQPIDIQAHPERVRRVKDLRPPGEPYRAPVAQLADLAPMTK